jgi:hypothetical protein
MFKRALICGAAAFLIATPFGVDLSRLSLQPVTAEAAVNVSFDVFFNDLQPYGSWVHTADYPYVFLPANVGPDWVPYTHGHWIYTDRYGWYFESDEPFATITYHYGRWAYSDEIGWYWVPGTRWAPAWVVWRRGEGHVGWAPLPPDRNGYAIDVSVTVTDVPESYWVFVPVREFLAPQLTVVVQWGDRARDVFARTQVVGPVVVQNNIVVNNVIDINFIQQQTKQKVVVRKVQEVNDPREAAQAPGNDTAVKAFVANVEPPKQDVKPKQVVDAKEAKTKAQGGGAAAANAGGAAGEAAGAAKGGVAAGSEKCKADASGKMPANCPPAEGQASGQPDKGQAGAAAANAEAKKPAEDNAKAGVAAKAEANKPAETDGKAGAAASAEVNKPAAGEKAGAAASADNCKPDASGNMPASCPATEGKGKAKAGAAAEANKPATEATGKPAVTEAKPAAGAKKKAGEEAAKAAPTENGATAATGSDNGAGPGKKKPAPGQAAEKGKGNKGCTPGEAGCEANAGDGKAAVSQEKTGAIGNGSGDNGNAGAVEPQVQTGQPGKCTPAMKKAGKC